MEKAKVNLYVWACIALVREEQNLTGGNTQ